MQRRTSACTAVLFFFVLPLFARDLPPIDEFGAGREHPDAGAVVAARARGLARAGMAIPVEARLKVPTFVWAGNPGNASNAPPQNPGQAGERRGRPEEVAARTYLGRYAQLYDLDANDVNDATVSAIHDTGRGPIIVKLRQQVDGIEIFREELSVVMDRKMELVGMAGYISSASTRGPQGIGFRLDDRSAARSALQDLTGVKGADLAASGSRGGYDYYTLPPSSGITLEAPMRVKKVYFHVQEGLVPGYYIEVIARDPVSETVDAYSYVIAATDGRILFRNNLTNEAGTAYTYRVWADPTGRPSDSPAGNTPHPHPAAAPNGFQAPLVAQTDITVANYPFSMNDPWLPPGSLETVGNNVDAYSDLFYPDGLVPTAPPATPATGDFRARTTGVNAFQHSYNMSDPYHHVQRQAATTQLFVDVNFLHDWFYDSGFNEAAGNAQQDNYGRGGLGGDRILAEAQDASGKNNANMYTPADGASPRMQMFIFDGNGSSAAFTVLSPAAAAGTRTIGLSNVGPTSYEVTADVVQPAPLTACTALTNAATVAGKIVLLDREPTSGPDSCAMSTRLTNIASAGAAGIVVANYSSWPDTGFVLSETLPGFSQPVLTVTWNGAAGIKSQLAAGNAVTATMVRQTAVTDRDGTLDNQIVAHEWGHYLSNRLIGNSSGLGTLQARGMGEGWSDFLSVLFTVREDDTANPTNATWNGTYAAGTFADSGGPNGGTNQGYYFAIRRAPYSTDFTKNPFTFKHIQHGVGLPTGAPLQLNGLSNAQVHNTGEIWANMLWECYASLLRDTQGGSPRLTFAQAQQRMKDYLVAGLKLTPVNPTFVEARDAILAAAYASDPVDFVNFYQAFAKRGLGSGAVAPDRYNGFNLPVTESFVATGDARLTSSSLNDAGGSCDGDGVLDHGESGQLTITLRNTGAATLNAVAGTITSLTTGVTLPSGGSVTFPNMAPFQNATVTVPVAMSAGVSGMQFAEFSLQFSHASLPAAQTVTMSFRANVDSVARATVTDTVDALATAWTVVSGTTAAVAPWTRRISGTRSFWHADNSATVSDERLESPQMTVSSTGSLKIEFDHTFVFESQYDGGVVEMSRNGGPWTDIGGTAYNGWIYSGWGNPIAGRNAFVGTMNPHHVVLNPQVVPGDLVRIRFRIGTDTVIGAPGWDIDNITVTGVLETPFHQTVADSGCTKSTVTQLVSSANPVNAGASLTLTAAVLAPGTPPGTVSFFNGGTVLATLPLSGGAATFSTSALSPGTHTLSAFYTGAAGYNGSASSLLTQVVDNCSTAPSITSLSPSTTVPVGSSVTLSVTAAGSPGIMYQWYAGAPGNTANAIGTGSSITFTAFSNTTYWVRVRNGCGFVNSAAVEVRIIPPARFYTVMPCRLVDTRNYEGPISTGQIRTYYVGYCGIPYNARAVSLNVTVVEPPGEGWLSVYPGESNFPGTSTMNYRTGRTRANNAIIPISQYGYLRVLNSGSRVHFIIDVNGYFQ